MKTHAPISPPENPASDEEILHRSIQEAHAIALSEKADRVTGAHGLAAETISQIFNINATAVAKRLEDEALEISGGTLSGLEGTLASQAATLNALFHRLTQFTLEEPRNLTDFSGYLKLALRAQAQSAHALEVLGNLKQGPRVVVTRQLNAAHQQIVNNAPPASAKRSRRGATATNVAPRSNSLPEPSPLPHDATLDTRSPGKAKPRHSTLEPVD